MAGPLAGYRIIEMGGLGPGPFAAMMLADHGAEVIRVERPGAALGIGDTMVRSRKLVMLDLKKEEDVASLRVLMKTAHGLIEVFRPGTMERLGLGPDVLLKDSPALVYARMTGWGQTGPYASFAGHDLNYIALSGAGHAIGTADRPVPPLALVGDYGGGGMMLAFAMTAALLHAEKTGTGQVIDCAMAEGAGLMMSQVYGMHAAGDWKDIRGVNILDGGAHFYNSYETADGKFVSIGSIEPQFYAQLLDALDLRDDPDFASQMDAARWPRLKERLAAIFRTRTREEWCSMMEHSDICFAPMLSLAEAPLHPQSVARASFTTLDGVVQPAPAPRYSETRLDPPRTSQAADIDALIRAKPKV